MSGSHLWCAVVPHSPYMSVALMTSLDPSTFFAYFTHTRDRDKERKEREIQEKLFTSFFMQFIV